MNIRSIYGVNYKAIRRATTGGLDPCSFQQKKESALVGVQSLCQKGQIPWIEKTWSQNLENQPPFFLCYSYKTLN